MDSPRNRLARPRKTNQPWPWILAGYAYFAIGVLESLTAILALWWGLTGQLDPTSAFTLAATHSLVALAILGMDAEAVRADKALEEAPPSRDTK